MKTNLTTAEWDTIIMLPADGRSYNVSGISFRAIHKPATTMHVEQVIAETRYGTLRRLKIGDKWTRADSVSGKAV